jgi:hypothetical protein
MDMMQRSEHDRYVLQTSFGIFQAAVARGVAGPQTVDAFALRLQELHDDGLVAFRSRSAGRIQRPVWDGAAIQELHDWRVTADGRRDALVFRQASASDDAAESRSSDATARPLPIGHDVFISHASEDKDAIARPLAVRLRQRGYGVWFDEFELKVGSSLRRSIDRGLAGARFGVVILSSSFFAKDWPQRELDGLAAIETATGRHSILPVWHELDQPAVALHSPTLADRVAVRSDQPIEEVVSQLAEAIGPPNAAQDEPATANLASQVRLSPPPANIELSLVLLGSQLTRLIDGSFEGIFDLDQLPPTPARREAAELFDEARDLLDVLSEYSFVQRDELEMDFTQRLSALLDQGIVVLGGSYERTLRSPAGVERWPGAALRAIELSEAQRQTVEAVRRGEDSDPRPA